MFSEKPSQPIWATILICLLVFDCLRYILSRWRLQTLSALIIEQDSTKLNITSTIIHKLSLSNIILMITVECVKFWHVVLIVRSDRLVIMTWYVTQAMNDHRRSFSMEHSLEFEQHQTKIRGTFRHSRQQTSKLTHTLKGTRGIHQCATKEKWSKARLIGKPNPRTSYRLWMLHFSRPVNTRILLSDVEAMSTISIVP